MFAIRALAIVLLGAALGLAWNQWSGRGFDLRANALLKPGDEEIKVPDAKKRHERGALFVDARPALIFKLQHISGAVSLPQDKFDEQFPALERRLRESMDIVVYCSGGGCEASHEVARKLKARGIPAVVLGDGWPGWEQAGHPAESDLQS
jgi:rhodanese-related sulfurtransferase